MPEHGSEFAVSAPLIFDGAEFLPNHCVTVQDGKVAQLLPLSDCPDSIQHLTLSQGTLAPGLIDLQVNGGGDVLFNNEPTQDSVHRITEAHLSKGTTALLPTVISDAKEVQYSAVAAAQQAIAAGNESVLGVHLEGPHFAEQKRGAHCASNIRPASREDIDWLQSLQDLLVLITVAPEEMPIGYIRALRDSGIIVCAGHTQATYAQIQRAMDEGLLGVTHLFNAMSPLTSREPGAVGAALEADTLWAGIIADGHHVHAAALRLAHACKPAGKLLLVSDAMATVGGTQTHFQLYGDRITERDGKLVNAQGALSGSAIGLIDAVRFAHQNAGIDLEECLRMASLYPAIALGLDKERGRIAPAYRADLVHFNDDFQVLQTWVGGRHRSHH
ncbi:MAG: N-acetylglucosamine-6-phosphate deacetylase [Pseudomonadota bacterium]